MEKIKISTFAPTSCQICNGKNIAKLGSKDFGISGNDHFEKRRMFPDYGLQIPYFRCSSCSFIFTNAFDQWSYQDFNKYIYNDEYIFSDPVFEQERPLRNAQMVFTLFPHDIESLSILDFGGGNGVFAETLSSMGCKATSFDYFHNKDSSTLKKSYDLITSFEVIEHVPHSKQHEWASALKTLLKPNQSARIIVSTKLLGHNASINDWYISPRNGHISIHSEASLSYLTKVANLTLFSLNSGVHFLCHSNNTPESFHFNTNKSASLSAAF